jgi:hypothetical protein
MAYMGFGWPPMRSDRFRNRFPLFDLLPSPGEQSALPSPSFARPENEMGAQRAPPAVDLTQSEPVLQTCQM